jgi:hypothetical protein
MTSGIIIALIVGFAAGYGFASGFPADGVKRRDSDVTFSARSGEAR